jgi:hypothetical protein
MSALHKTNGVAGSESTAHAVSLSQNNEDPSCAVIVATQVRMNQQLRTHTPEVEEVAD